MRTPRRHSAAHGMRRAALGSALFLCLAPGTVAGVGPWMLTRWRIEPATSAFDRAAKALGAILIAAGAAMLVSAFVDFVTKGRGTPAPVAPTHALVVQGAYRYVRNPMYLAVTATIVGQALLLGRPALLAYAAVVAGAMGTFVYLYEEPTLAARYGQHYELYCAAVPRWRPRLRPWKPNHR
jgi:protein-S-isoprenylcysteine O-methyltransferase Ste14